MNFDAHHPHTATTVWNACKENDADTLQRLIGEGKSVITMDNRGYQPLHIAAENGHTRCQEILLGQGMHIESPFANVIETVTLESENFHDSKQENKGWPRHFSRCLKCFSLFQREK